MDFNALLCSLSHFLKGVQVSDFVKMQGVNVWSSLQMSFRPNIPGGTELLKNQLIKLSNSLRIKQRNVSACFTVGLKCRSALQHGNQ